MGLLGSQIGVGASSNSFLLEILYVKFKISGMYYCIGIGLGHNV